MYHTQIPIQHVLFVWLVGYILAVLYWRSKGEHIGCCIFGSIFTGSIIAGLILAIVSLFYGNYPPSPFPEFKKITTPSFFSSNKTQNNFDNPSKINSFNTSSISTPQINSHDQFLISKNVATDLFRGTFDATSKTNRIAIANDILNHVNLLDNLIASPTPDELSWINAEDEATKHELLSTRRTNLIDSTEIQQYKLKNYLTSIRTSIQKITTSDNLKDEMYLWGNLSSLLIDELTLNDALYTLKMNGKLPYEIKQIRNICIGNGDHAADYNICYHGFGEGILNYILIPFLHTEKMDNP